MYSGVLDLRYGIKELLDAMNMLDDKYELWLTGNGNAVPLIEERAKTDERIKYFGYFPSRLDLLKKQREATMLISTRDPSEPASRYCFPSKIFEYMVSGNPVLSTVIDGIPDEYFNYIIPLESISPEMLSEKIKGVASMDKKNRDEFGDKARRFVLESKKRSKRSVVIEKTIFPEGRHGSLNCPVGQKAKMAYSFKKITLSKDQVLKVYLYEHGGQRNLEMTIDTNDINKAERSL
jgi:glycosyltransferase involved in cell wall biosynthesis